MNYYVAIGESIDDLMKDVEEHFKEGYLLQGGVAVSDDDRDGVVFYQAMVKVEKEENPGRNLPDVDRRTKT